MAATQVRNRALSGSLIGSLSEPVLVTVVSSELTFVQGSLKRIFSNLRVGHKSLGGRVGVKKTRREWGGYIG